MQCRHHPTCPGCPLLDLPYAAQLEEKRSRLAAALARYPHLGLPPVPPVLGALRTEGYRHRLKLPVEARGDRVAIGLYADAGHAVLDTPDCPVLEPRLRDGLGRVRAALVGHDEVHSVDLRVSDATGELQLVLAAVGGEVRGGKRTVRALMEAVPGLVSVALSTADPERKRVMGRRPAVVAGKPHVEEAIGATRYRLHPGAFFQADPRNATQLHALVRELVGDARTVLDLYAGVGAYALALAPGRDRVVMVEEVTQATRAAAELAPRNVEVVNAKVESLDMREPFDVAILNPARRGSDPATLERVARLARRLVYVSCGPEALARDLDILATFGMRVDRIQPLDLFPQTPEVETVVSLSRGEPLRTWAIPNGRAGGPWLGHPSGAIGRTREALALVLGDSGRGAKVPGGSFEKLGTVATHSLIRLTLSAPPTVALRALAQRGHATVGFEPKTAWFFAEKAGLLRPFVHVTRAEGATAPLHGDLVQALVSLGADDALLAKVGVS